MEAAAAQRLNQLLEGDQQQATSSGAACQQAMVQGETESVCALAAAHDASAAGCSSWLAVDVSLHAAATLSANCADARPSSCSLDCLTCPPSMLGRFFGTQS